VAVALHVVATAFLGYSVVAIMKTVHKEEAVSADSVYGAFCSYLLVGLAFGHVYCLIETVFPGSFLFREPRAAPAGGEQMEYFLLTYFSFVTLTTVGFGDITPAHAAARSLAVVEAVTGQFFIAILIAELIGKRVAQAVTEQKPDTKGP
jgi:hypothetical protein